MRSAGVVDGGQGLGSHDHLCWVYDDTAEMLTVAEEFLADGIRSGHRVGYIGGSGLLPMSELLSALSTAVGRPDSAFVEDLSEM
jgi:uncharacterized protein YbjT (DUF2867 family)